MLALTDFAGDTAGVMRDVGLNTIVPLDDVDEIADGLTSFVANIADGTASFPDPVKVAQYSRKAGSADLATLLSAIVE